MMHESNDWCLVDERMVDQEQETARRNFLSLIEPYGLTVTDEALRRWWPRGAK